VVNTGILRDNLVLEVRRTVNRELKLEALLGLLRREEGSGIVYAATVRRVDELWRWLRGQGVEAGRYHGKLRHAEREETQRRFMDGQARVIVATKAFGMGIDKPDIRFVVHWNFPDSLESYYQEAGRAGRDGRPARATLLFRLEDRRIQGYFLGGKYPRRDESQRLYDTLRAQGAQAAGKPVSLAKLGAAADLPAKRVKVLVAQLEGAGVLARAARGVRLVRAFDDPAELDAYLGAYETRHRGDHERLQRMMGYAQALRCRWRLLGDYFGEPLWGDCGHCDVCHARAQGHEGTALLGATAPSP
jgi:ATP-dependent DNA helicase RecQ